MFPGPVRGAQRAVGRHHQASVPTVGQQLDLGQVGVALYLSKQNKETPVWLKTFTASFSPQLFGAVHLNIMYL